MWQKRHGASGLGIWESYKRQHWRRHCATSWNRTNALIKLAWGQSCNTGILSSTGPSETTEALTRSHHSNGLLSVYKQEPCGQKQHGATVGVLISGHGIWESYKRQHWRRHHVTSWNRTHALIKLAKGQSCNTGILSSTSSSETPEAETQHVRSQLQLTLERGCGV